MMTRKMWRQAVKELKKLGGVVEQVDGKIVEIALKTKRVPLHFRCFHDFPICANCICTIFQSQRMITRCSQRLADWKNCMLCIVVRWVALASKQLAHCLG